MGRTEAIIRGRGGATAFRFTHIKHIVRRRVGGGGGQGQSIFVGRNELHTFLDGSIINAIGTQTTTTINPIYYNSEIPEYVGGVV